MSRGTIRLGMTNLLILSPVPNRVIQVPRYNCQRAREARKLNEVTVLSVRGT